MTLITRAVEPFVDAAQLADCRHLNAVGAILPAKAEFAQDVFERADRVVVDDLENARRGSRELRERYGVDASSWPGVSRLSDVLAAGETRAPDARLMLFKGMGMGLSDLAMATVVYEQALARGLGVAAAADPREPAAGAGLTPTFNETAGASAGGKRRQACSSTSAGPRPANRTSGRPS